MKNKYVTEYEMFYLKELLVKRISELFRLDREGIPMTYKGALEIIEILKVLDTIAD